MAKRLIDLNTSCIAHFKNGDTKTFSSIEEASNETGLSIATIKIRCNRKGTSGKDKTTFEWIDSYTKKYYQAKKSKSKGSKLEYDVVDKLKEIGYTGCVRSAGESKNADNNKIDIVDTLNELPVYIQCKNTANTPSYFKIKEACTKKDLPFCLIWKKPPEDGKTSKGAVAIIPLDYFYKLIKK